MSGRDDAYVDAWELAYHAHLRGRRLCSSAARCTWWIGDYLRFRGDTARATGWFARGHRLLDRVGDDCVARGYLLLPTLHDHVLDGDHEAASAVAAEAGRIGERFGDRDLMALAMMEQGHALVSQGRVDDGLRLVDETMVAVTTEELSPIIAGTVYCNTIAFCQSVFELGRAREWTDAHSRWCERHPDMVAYMGLCLVHRAEIMTFAGDWSEAMMEVRRAEGYSRGVLNERVAGHAAYRRGEVHFLQGELRSRRGGLPGGQPARAGAAAGPRAPPPGSGRGRVGGSLAAAGAERGHTAVDACGAASGLRRDHACRRRARGGTRGLPRARGRRRAPRQPRARRDVGLRSRGGRPGRRRPGRRPGPAAPGLPGLAGARSPARDRTHPRAGGPGMRRAGGSRHGRDGARGGRRDVHAIGSGAGAGPDRVAHPPAARPILTG